MKKYKYFYLNDKKREVCGVVKAEDVNEAFLIASKIKNLDLKKFKKMFNVEVM